MPSYSKICTLCLLHSRHSLPGGFPGPDRTLTGRCNKIWENRSQDIGAAAVAVPRSHFPSRSNHRDSSPFSGKRPANAKSRNHHFFNHARPSQRQHLRTAGVSTTPASDHGPRGARTAARTRKMSRPAVATRIAAAGPTHPCCPPPPPPRHSTGICHRHGFLTRKELDFSSRYKQQFQFLSRYQCITVHFAARGVERQDHPDSRHGDFANLLSAFPVKISHLIFYLQLSVSPLLYLAWIFFRILAFLK